MPEVEDITAEAMENYIGAEIIISHGDIVSQGSVRRRKRDVEGNTIGRANINPILDTQTYEVEFKDGITIGSTNGISFYIVLPVPNTSLSHFITMRYNYLCPNIIFYCLRRNVIHIRHVILMLLIILIRIKIWRDNLQVTLKIFS